MAKKDNKDTDPTNEGDVAGTTQEETSAVVSSKPEEEALAPEPDSIESEEEALALVSTKYPHLKGENLLVTQDKNVFQEKNISSGANHAEKNNLKSFRIKCLD